MMMRLINHLEFLFYQDYTDILTTTVKTFEMVPGCFFVFYVGGLWDGFHSEPIIQSINQYAGLSEYFWCHLVAEHWEAKKSSTSSIYRPNQEGDLKMPLHKVVRLFRANEEPDLIICWFLVSTRNSSGLQIDSVLTRSAYRSDPMKRGNGRW